MLNNPMNEFDLNKRHFQSLRLATCVLLLLSSWEHCRCFFVFLTTTDVCSSGCVKPASDFVVTCHSNFSRTDLSHNTAISTWIQEVWAGVLQSCRTSHSCNKPLSKLVDVNIANQTKLVAGVELLRQTLRTMRLVWLQADFASLCAQRCTRSLNEETAHPLWIHSLLSRWLGRYIPFCTPHEVRIATIFSI